MSPLKETSECVNCPLLQLPPDKIHSFVLFHLNQHTNNDKLQQMITVLNSTIKYVSAYKFTVQSGEAINVLDSNPSIMRSVIRNDDNHKIIMR